jgi:hypothetical protein
MHIYRQFIENKDQYVFLNCISNSYLIIRLFLSFSLRLDNNNDNLNQYQIMCPFTTNINDNKQQLQQQHHQQHIHLPQNPHLTHHQQQRNSTTSSNTNNNHISNNNTFSATIINQLTSSNNHNNSKTALLSNNNDNNTNLNSLNASINGSQANNFVRSLSLSLSLSLIFIYFSILASFL